MPDADYAANLASKIPIRLYNIDNLIAIYTGASNNSYAAASQTAGKAAVMAAVASALGVLETAYTISAGDISDATDTIEAALNASIPNTVSTDKTAVLTQIRTEYIAGVNVTRTFPDLRCMTGGVPKGCYPSNNDLTEDPADTSLKHCTTCNGFGYTETVVQPVKVWPGTEL